MTPFDQNEDNIKRSSDALHKRLKILAAELDEGKIEFQHSNGKNIIYQRTKYKDDASISLILHLNDTVDEKKYGLGHICEHLMARELKSELSSFKIKYRFQAKTRLDRIILQTSIPQEYTEKIIELYIQLILGRPNHINYTALKSELKSIEHEMLSILNNPSDVCFINLFRVAYPDHPYRIGDPAGELQSVMNVDLRTVATYYRKLVCQPNVTILVVSDFGEVSSASLLLKNMLDRATDKFIT